MLENQRDGAVETVREAAQHPGRAQQHGRVGVMTARVHDTVHRGGEGVPGLLLQRQGVQVRAQRHCPTRPPALDQYRHRGLGGGLGGEAKAREFLPHEVGCRVLLVGQLRVGVDVAAPVDDVGRGSLDLRGREPSRRNHPTIRSLVNHA